MTHDDSSATVRVLVADPHTCVREGVKAILGALPEVRVVGEASDGQTALALAAALNPDLVILEASLPGLDGAQVAARLREARPGLKVLVLTACESAATVRLLLGAGARGCVLKRSPAERLIQAVLTVAAGETYLDPEAAGGVVGDFLAAGDEKADAELSAREAQVLRLIALGYSNKEIAARLKLSVKTVETYKTRSMEKLEVRSRVAIVRYALRCGWLEDVDAEPPAARSGSVLVSS